jgi:hypothetical protein
VDFVVEPARGLNYWSGSGNPGSWI